MKVNFLKKISNVITVILVSVSLIFASFPVEAKSRKSNSHAQSYKAKKTLRSSSRRYNKSGKRVRTSRIRKLRIRTPKVSQRRLRAKRVSSPRRQVIRSKRINRSQRAKTYSLPNQAVPFVFTPPPVTLQPIDDYWSAENIARRAAQCQEELAALNARHENERLAREEGWRQQAAERERERLAREEVSRQQAAERENERLAREEGWRQQAAEVWRQQAAERERERLAREEVWRQQAAERERERLAREEVWRQAAQPEAEAQAQREATQPEAEAQAQQEAAQRVRLAQVRREVYAELAKAEYELEQALARLDQPEIGLHAQHEFQHELNRVLDRAETARRRVDQHEVDTQIRPEEGQAHLAAARRSLADARARLERANEERRQAPARQLARDRRAREKAAQAEAAKREDKARIDEARREQEENRRQDAQHAQQLEARRQQRLAAERQQDERDAATSFVVGTAEPVGAITTLLNTLINSMAKVQNVMAFHWLKVTAPAKADIITAVAEQFTNGQIANNNKLAFKTALIDETLMRGAVVKDVHVQAIALNEKVQDYEGVLAQVERAFDKILTRPKPIVVITEEGEKVVLEPDTRVSQAVGLIMDRTEKYVDALRQVEALFNIKPLVTTEAIQAAVLIKEGKAGNYENAVEQVKALSKIRQLGTVDRPIDWEEAKKLSSFIAKSKINDHRIAKFYYDFAQQCLDTGIGNSVETNRDYIARILEDKVTHEDDKLSMATDIQGKFFKRENYITRHLRDALATPSIDHYIEARDKDVCRQKYREEKELRDANTEEAKRRLARARFTYAATENRNLIAGDTDNIVLACHGLAAKYAGLKTRINFAYSYEDPYLGYLLAADNDLPQHPVTVQNITDTANDLKRALRAYAPNHAIEVPDAVQSCADMDEVLGVIHGEENKPAFMRARMIRALKNATEGEDALDGNTDVAKALFALAISQNMGRCIDGLSDWLSAFEMERIYKAPKNMGFAVKVSALIAREKNEFIARHKPNTQSELATVGPSLLGGRMRAGFGLIGHSTPVTYPGFGGTERATAYIYDPVQACKRFYEGGEIAFDNRADPYNYVEFKPFDANCLITKVRKEWLAGRLKREELIDEVHKDWILKQAFKEIADAELKENKYFKYIDPDDPEAWKEQFKPAFFKRLLCRTGHLIDNAEEPFDR